MSNVYVPGPEEQMDNAILACLAVMQAMPSDAAFADALVEAIGDRTSEAFVIALWGEKYDQAMARWEHRNCYGGGHFPTWECYSKRTSAASTALTCLGSHVGCDGLRRAFHAPPERWLNRILRRY